MALSESEIVNICRQELNRAQGWDSDELASNRENALDYFYNRPRGDEKAGRSSIQSSDVSDMVEAVTANIAPILTNDTLIQFTAAGEDDEDNAQLESDFVAMQAAGQNDSYVEILSAIKDALLLRNGFIKVSVDEFRHTENFTKSDIAEHEILALIEDTRDNETNLEVTNLEDNDDGSAFNVTFKKTILRKTLKVSAVAPEDMLYASNHTSPNLEDINFIAERKLLTQTDLIGMGYSVKMVKALPGYDVDTKNDSVARRQDENISLETSDPATRIIETYDIHIMLDIKQSGSAELWHIHIASHEILMREKALWVPYATGSPFLVPHRLYGLSLFDKLRTIQDSKTHFLRQWHDNAKAVNNSRFAVIENKVNMDDVLNSRPGGAIRTKMAGAIEPIITSDQGASIQGALTYLDKIRSERGGASLDMSSADMQLAGQVGDQGAERQISMREQLAGQMTATLANTLIRGTYLLIHKTLRQYMAGELTAKLNGKWVQTDTSQWPERKNVKVMTGLSQGEKIARLSALTTVITTQVSFINQGQEGEIVDKKNVFNAIMDWARAANLENPEQYWIDPDSEEAQAAAKQKQEQAQQAQQAQQQAIQQQQQEQTAMQQQIFAMQAQLDKYKHDGDLAFKYDDARLKSEIEESKIIGQATLDLEREQLKFDNQAAAQQTAEAAQ